MSLPITQPSASPKVAASCCVGFKKAPPKLDPPKPLPMIAALGETIFCQEILGFLSAEEIVTLLQHEEDDYEEDKDKQEDAFLSRLFNLKDNFCRAHGRRLKAETTKRKRAEEEENDISQQPASASTWNEQAAASEEVVDAYYQHDRQFREWCTKNPVVHPDRCSDCTMAQKGLEKCKGCETHVKWTQFLECRQCHNRGCVSCYGNDIIEADRTCDICNGWICGKCDHGFVCDICDRYCCGEGWGDEECAKQRCAYCSKPMCSNCLYRGDHICEQGDDEEISL